MSTTASASAAAAVGGYNFNFGSSQYAACFADLPKPDTEALRASALDYLDKFQPQTWYDDPVTCILNGEKLVNDDSSSPQQQPCITKDALSNPNGHQYFATPDQVQRLKKHIQTYKSPYKDIRTQVRRIEQLLLSAEASPDNNPKNNGYAGFLIGNQCLDFQKQDGVTEMEESIMANAVERRLNDLLLQAEASNGNNGNKKVVNIQRHKPIYVSCVSNFTNFLDLFRKTIRNLELGIPCVVLGRSNTTQHSYRWTALLVELLQQEGIDAGMLTYLSCHLDDIKDITRSCRDSTGMLYTTCSRELAASIIAGDGNGNGNGSGNGGYPNTVASTGGPNTLVSTEWTPAVQEAIRMSATIECAGQCTALRHCVVPSTVTPQDVEAMFDGDAAPRQLPPTAHSATEALKHGNFDCIFAQHEGTKAPPTITTTTTTNTTNTNGDGDEGCYMKHKVKDVYYKVSSTMPPDGIHEYWRKAVVDVTTGAPPATNDSDGNDNDNDKDTTTTTTTTTKKKKKIDALAKWLIHNQPISLAVNAPRPQCLALGLELFEKTALVVYTVGSSSSSSSLDNQPPAMTCQARPQEAEVFGEFPPRKTLASYTKYPVVVPSSTPAYDATYQVDYLEGLTTTTTTTTTTTSSSSDLDVGLKYGYAYVQKAMDAVKQASVKGYCMELFHYLVDATAVNPKRGFGTDRTALWGLQRPPLLRGTRMTLLRCSNNNNNNNSNAVVTYDDLLPVLLPFYVTNARTQVEVSVNDNDNDNDNAANSAATAELLSILTSTAIKDAVKVTVENDRTYQERIHHKNNDNKGDEEDDDEEEYYNIVEIQHNNAYAMTDTAAYPMVGQFVSLYFPLGHIKSTMSGDEAFVEHFTKSDKWLKMHTDA